MLKYWIIVLTLCCDTIHVLGQNKSSKLYDKVTKFDENDEVEKLLKLSTKIDTYGESQYDTLAATMYFLLGVNQMYEGELALSTTNIRKAIAIRDSLGWLSDEERFDYIYYLAASEWYNEDYVNAQKTFLVLLNLGKALYTPDDDYTLFVYQEYAKFLEEQGKIDAADSVLSYAILKGKGNQYSLPSLQSYQALIANELGEYPRAKRLYFASIEGLELIKEEDPISYASTLSNLGNLYYDLGQYPVSEQMQTKALKEFELVGMNNSKDALVARHNLAYVNNALGQRQKALTILKKIIALEKESQGETLSAATTLSSLGLVYVDLGNYDTAIYYFDKAGSIVLDKKGFNSRDYASILNNKAKAFLRNNELDSAKANSKRALQIMQGVVENDNPEISSYQHNLGLIYYANNNYEKADLYLSRALELRELKLGKLNPKYAETAFELGKLMWAQNNLENANDFFSSAFGSYLNQVKVFFPTMSEYERTKFYVEKIKPSVELYYSYALENPNNLVINEMMYYRLQTKGLLYYSSAAVRRSILASGDQELINNYNLWLKKRDGLAKLIQNNRSTQDINKLWSEVNRLEKQISETSASFSSSTKPVFLADIKQKLKENEAAVEIIRFNLYNPASGGIKLDSINYAAIIISPNHQVEVTVLKNGNILESKYLNYYSNVTKFLRDDLRSYYQYWEPIEEKINGSNTVYVSTDGVYNNININILYNPESSKYVLDDKNVIPLTNLSDISKRKDPFTPRKTSYFFGYPDYNKLPSGTNNASTSIDEKIAEAEDNASFKLVSSSLYANLISNSLFKPLPGTLIEVEQIQELYIKSNSSYKVFLKEDATESALKKVDSPTLLHIATHGFFLPTMNSSREGNTAESNPLLQSGLVLAGAQKLQENPSLSNENGILTAYEAMNLNLNNTQLVVMSACETGLGTISNGEGVYGLQRAFQIAGAKSVVMSMWTVNDTATQQLMKHFYTNWIAGQDKHEAFRNAQLELKKTYAKPYYWGAFIMNGL